MSKLGKNLAGLTEHVDKDSTPLEVEVIAKKVKDSLEE